jgi:hypothetical protein
MKKRKNDVEEGRRRRKEKEMEKETMKIMKKTE